MSARRQEEFEDDGRTIADMSEVTHRSLFGAAPRGTDHIPKAATQSAEAGREEVSLTPEERRWAFLGMMKAVLLVGLCFAVGLALVILAFLYL